MKKLESVSYATMIFGTAADQISTRIGISHPEIYESNSLPRYLMTIGLWLPFDVIFISSMIAVIFIILRKWKFRDRWTILAYPYTYGVIRFLAGIWNTFLYCSIVGVN